MTKFGALGLVRQRASSTTLTKACPSALCRAFIAATEPGALREDRLFDYAEFAAIVAQPSAAPGGGPTLPGAPTLEDELREAFARMDLDHDGELSVEDVCRSLSQAGAVWGAEQAAQMVEAVAGAGARRVTLKQFIAAALGRQVPSHASAK
jgi:Ca2+-binding EF-hand superfamily protein